MIKTILISLILMLALGLSAQTGVFELSFGDSPETAKENLADDGFSVSSDLDTYVQMISVDNDYVEYIDLIFNETDKTLEGWTIVYLAQEDEDIEDIVIEALVSWHGEDYDYDEDYEEYYWDLGNNHSVYAGYDSSYETFWVEYSTD